MEQPTMKKSLLFVEEEEVPMLPLHHPAHEQTSLCPTLEQKIVCVRASMRVCSCECISECVNVCVCGCGSGMNGLHLNS